MRKQAKQQLLKTYLSKMDMDKKVSELRQLSGAVDSELESLMKVRNSEEYKAFNNKIAELSLERDAMLPRSPKTNEYRLVVAEILEEARKTHDYAIDGIEFEFKAKNEVNQSRLFEILGGDIGIFQELSDVTQKKLKDYAKTQPDIKKALLGCIREVSNEAVSLKLT